MPFLLPVALGLGKLLIELAHADLLFQLRNSLGKLGQLIVPLRDGLLDGRLQRLLLTQGFSALAQRDAGGFRFAGVGIEFDISKYRLP